VALPVYVYECNDCESRTERRQSFSDAPLTKCDVCSGTLRRVLQPASVIFKGSGFYSTDNRSKSGGNGTHSSDNGTDGSKSEESPGKPAEASPAKPAEEAAKPVSSTD
jgi:putative FmdB family regulatory protein